MIYLDFDGQTIAGTGWNGNTGGTCYADPYDSDGKPTFSDDERAAIVGTWARVAEDYASMDVDVTEPADPGVDAINRSSGLDSRYGTRVVVTYSRSLCPNGKTLYASVCGGGCGGVSYVGVFDQTPNHDYYQPALVFQNSVGFDQKLIAEAASHEVGHTGGLSHDGNATVPLRLGTRQLGADHGRGLLPADHPVEQGRVRRRQPDRGRLRRHAIERPAPRRRRLPGPVPAPLTPASRAPGSSPAAATSTPSRSRSRLRPRSP